jgi:Fur family ferric uptake transcriptional regulator
MTNNTRSGYSLRKHLNQEGFRLTYQRQLILNLFKQLDEGYHLSAEEIHYQLAQQGNRISLSTIYRTLHMMVKLRVLRELELADDKKYYELNPALSAWHHHLVCVQCGTVQEFSAELISQIGLNQSAMRGYTLLDCQFTVYGICTACLNHK